MRGFAPRRSPRPAIGGLPELLRRGVTRWEGPPWHKSAPLSPVTPQRDRHKPRNGKNFMRCRVRRGWWDLGAHFPVMRGQGDTTPSLDDVRPVVTKYFTFRGGQGVERAVFEERSVRHPGLSTSFWETTSIVDRTPGRCSICSWRAVSGMRQSS
jgi:hypothetical protein